MLRILVIEDSPVNMALTVAILESAGHSILQADHAAEGIEIARREQPDLILMDIQLPDIDGIAALGRIRADASLDRMPVLAISASVMPDEQQKIVASGFDAFITKPINIKSFQETVQRFLEQGRRTS